METGTTPGGLRNAVIDAAGRVVEHLPAIAAALVVIVLGFVLGRLARGAARHGVDLVNRLLERVLRRGAASRVRLSPATVTVLGELTFWLVFLFSLLIAAQVSGLASLTLWIGDALRHLPNLIVGVAIIVVGYFASIFVREIARNFGGSSHAEGVGRSLQAAVVAVATVVGLDQVGVDVTALVVLIGIGAAAAAGGLVAAFGIGARQHVRNLVGARNARRELHAGLRIRVGEHEGEILDISRTVVALDTAEGRLLLPAARLDEEPVLIVTDMADKEGEHDG